VEFDTRVGTSMIHYECDRVWKNVESRTYHLTLCFAIVKFLLRRVASIPCSINKRLY